MRVTGDISSVVVRLSEYLGFKTEGIEFSSKVKFPFTVIDGKDA